MELKVCYTGFWSSFNPNDNLFSRVLEEEFGLKLKIVRSGDKSDLEISSVFHLPRFISRASSFAISRLSKSREVEYANRTRYGFVSRFESKSTRRIWYTGENYRTPYDSADGYLGFDKDDRELNVIYFPHWMYRLFSESNQIKISDSNFDYLMSPRQPIERSVSACTFSSALDPRRLLIINILGEFLPVEMYGSAFNRKVQDKRTTSTNFGLQVCPENTISPGYVTEKLLDSWICGNVPIWEGLDSLGYFNQKAFIDVTGKNSADIRKLFVGLDEDTLQGMRTQPILLKPPSLTPLIDLLGSIL